MTDTLHDSFGYWISRLARSMREGVDADFAKLGLNVAHWAILATCEERPMRVVEVAKRVGVDAAGITRLIEKLVAMGYVLREPDPDDRRAQRISLTREGQDMLPILKEISARHNTWWLEELGGLDPLEWIGRIDGAVRRSQALRADRDAG
jgi:DNA-binding MarR family transcriptional regulator